MDGDWSHPHFEKIMPFQAENLRIFALASSVWHEPKVALDPAGKIKVTSPACLTSPEGCIYTSQSADLVPQNAPTNTMRSMIRAGANLGFRESIPTCYARKMPWLRPASANALRRRAASAGALTSARRAAEWASAHRALPGGGFPPCRDRFRRPIPLPIPWRWAAPFWRSTR